MIRISASTLRNCKSSLVENCRSVIVAGNKEIGSGIEIKRRDMSTNVKSTPLGGKFGLPKRYGDFSPSVWYALTVLYVSIF